MLRKMIIHGLLAAVLIGSAAAVYAQAKVDNGYLSPASAAPSVPSGTSPNSSVAKAGEGYLKPGPNRFCKDDDQGKGKYRDRHDGRKLHHDKDDDD